MHDAKETVELMRTPIQPIEGYLGKRSHNQLKEMGYILWMPYRKNMAEAKKHNNYLLMAIRRTTESDFSLLTYYSAENNRACSLTGF